MVIAIDFDGTCVTHEFPKVGKDIGAVPVLKELIANGHQLILFTMRSDKKEVMSSGKQIHGRSDRYLTAAVNWFKKNDIPLYGIQVNPTQRIWTESPKAYAEMYIDDAALGCPLKYDKEFSQRPFVDWVKVGETLENYGLIAPQTKDEPIKE
jgi:hypothetical protein